MEVGIGVVPFTLRRPLTARGTEKKDGAGSGGVPLCRGRPRLSFDDFTGRRNMLNIFLQPFVSFRVVTIPDNGFGILI